MASSSSKKVPSGKVYLQVVGTDSVDTTPSLLIFTDSQRYLFNCGEGTQRLFNENKLRLSKLNNIFFTQITWEYIGGLPGMAMTLRDNGRANLGLYGPENIKDFIKATRFFLFHEKLNFDCVGYGDDNQDVYSDENMMICPVLLSDKAKNFSRKEEQKENLPKRVKLDSCTNKNIACYICKLAALPGKFLVQKAKELGVPTGPLFGKLKDGKDIILENGVKVLAEQVKEPDQEGPIFFIIDCPSTQYIPSIVECEQFVKYQDTCRHQDRSQVQPCLIVHLVPMEVFNDCRYKMWRQGFGSTTQHLLINKEACSKAMVFQSQARIQVQLHTIDRSMFPILHYADTPTIDPETFPANTKPGEFFLKFHLRPLKQQGYDRSGMQDPLDFNTIIKETTELLKSIVKTEQQPETEEKTTQNDEKDDACSPKLGKISLQKLKDKDIVENVSEILLSENAITEENAPLYKCENEDYDNVCERGKQKDFEIIFLGTGASLPSKYRNVSATMINVGCQSSVLLDCGEGTLGQLYRHYGNGMGDVIGQLKCVFISHIHADHHLGLPRILLYRQKHQVSDSNDNRMIVIGPEKLNLWLQEYSVNCEELHYRFIDCAQIAEAEHEFSEEFHCIEAKEILTVPVDHCAQAYGLVLQHTSGWKVVYSGDTRPCPALIHAGSDATVLIHEATFEDVLKDEAVDKKHSTTTEAITSGIEMNATFTMLNHFSQRYPKIPVFNEKFTRHTGIAFDHMKVRQEDLSKIPRLVGPLNVLFANEVEDMNKRTKTSVPCTGENTTELQDEKSSS